MNANDVMVSGWVPEEHDPKDLVFAQPSKEPQRALRAPARAPDAERETALPPRVDLREWCGDVRFQGGYPTCNAYVVCGLLEYFEKRSAGESIPPSPRFLFKVVKNFTKTKNADPVYIRQIMGVLKMIGVPPEEHWPYPEVTQNAQGQYLRDVKALLEEPPAFCYAVAADYRAITYYRLDPRNPDGTLAIQPDALLATLKARCAAEVPVTLGFPLYPGVVANSINSMGHPPGLMPYPAPGDEEAGGHAVIVVGYDDDKPMGSAGDGGSETTSQGALLIQNSWGDKWGDGGFGWLSYEYVLKDRVRDLWTLTHADWTSGAEFDLVTQPAGEAS